MSRKSVPPFEQLDSEVKDSLSLVFDFYRETKRQGGVAGNQEDRDAVSELMFDYFLGARVDPAEWSEAIRSLIEVTDSEAFHPTINYSKHQAAAAALQHWLATLLYTS